ncbi:MAG TPA: ferrous iron transporter B [Actinotalea sp.]|nr:ferrous iron transporter B [Actinotalea sp.]
MTTAPAERPEVATLTRDAVLLVGNPNVGKSTLFNRLTGARQRAVNAPGTTVELHTGTWQTPHGPIRLVDLPGTYSLVARSPDERVVVDALAVGRGPVVVVLEATAPARSLYLLAQVARAGRPVVAAVSMVDVALEHGVPLDVDRLATILGVPVVPVDPRTGAGVEALAGALGSAGAVHGLEPDAPDAPDDGAGRDVAARLARAQQLFDWVEQVVAELQVPPAPGRTRTDRVDAVLLNPWLGVPVFLVSLWTLFELATTAAAPVMALVGGWVTGPLTAGVEAVLAGWAPPWLESLVLDGVLAGVATVATFVPLMAIVYTALALLEDSGYLARVAFLADRAMRVIGLDGRAMLPLVVGFGCNVPAVAATRTLPDARRRLLTGLLVPWTSCAARLTVYVLLAGIFFPEHAGTAIFAMYLLSVLLVVAGGLAMRGTLFRDLRQESLVLVLPAYQRPRLGAIARSVGSRVAAFVRTTGRVVVLTLVVIWVLLSVPAPELLGGPPAGAGAPVSVEDSLYGRAAAAVAPVFTPAGFGDWHLSAALAGGFVAKEVVVGQLAQSYAVSEPADPAEAGAGLADALSRTFTATSGGHPAAAALAFMVFVLGYTPCLATVAEQRRQLGGRWTFGAILVQLAVAWVMAVLVFQVGRLL